MQPDSHWFFFAKNDLHTAEILFREQVWNQVCFHAQQAVEKILKSFMLPDQRPRSHKMADLVNRCELALSKEFQAELILLDRFYIPTRYPDALPGTLETGMPGKEDAENALSVARELLKIAEGDGLVE